MVRLIGNQEGEETLVWLKYFEYGCLRRHKAREAVNHLSAGKASGEHRLGHR
jgi:hypothetical protein